LRAKAPVAYGIAQTPGEIRDILAKTLVALQYFVPRCVVFATVRAIDTVLYSTLTGNHAPIGYYFSMKMAAIVDRRYMSLIVMLRR
jgi:hypothetical protein